MLSINRMYKIPAVLLLLSILFLLPASCKEKTDSGTPDVSANELTVPTNEEAIILFFSGSVDIVSNGERREALIGDILGKEDTVEVKSDSSCEIQIGETALIYVEADSIVELSSLYSEGRGADVELDLQQGSVMCKVNRLLGNERFEVKTQTTTAGVRGTQFLVRSDDGSTTTLAVKEGAVQLKPTLDLAELAADGTEQEVSDFLAALDEEFPVIAGGEEVTITPEVSESARQSYQAIKTILEEKTGAEQTAALDELKAAGTQLTSFGTSGNISDENREKLEILDNRELISFTEEEAVQPVRVRIEGPAGSILSVDGLKTASNVFNGLLEPDTEVTVVLVKNGFYPRQETVTPQTGEDNTFSFSLEEIPDKDYTINVQPANAEIVVNGETVGTGSFRGTLESEDIAEVYAHAPGYNPVWAVIEFSEEDETLNLVLEETLIANYKPTTSKITGMTTYNGLLVYSDFDGSLSAVRGGSQKVWTVPTINTEIEASTPEIINNTIAISGLNELVVVNGNTGEIVFRKTLGPGEQHIFGRHPVAFSESIVYPNNDGFRVLNGTTGESTASVVLSGGTRMTPVVYNNRIYLANQDGNVYIYDINGNQRGSITTQANRPIALSMAISDGFGYFADKEGMLIKVNLSRESVVWQKRLQRGETIPVSESLVIADNNILAYSRGVLYGVDKETGEVIFSSQDVYTSPPQVYNNVAYIGGKDKKIYAINADTGEILTSAVLNDTVSCRPVFGMGKILLGTEKGSIFEIRPVEQPLF